MAPKKREDIIEWISAPEAIQVLEQVNGRPIHRKYLYILAKQNRMARKPLDGRTYLYSKQDAEKIHLIERKGAGRKPYKTEPRLKAIQPNEGKHAA